MAVWTKQIVRHAMAVKAAAVVLAALTIIIAVAVPLYNSISSVGKKIKSREKEAVELTNRVSILSSLDLEVLKQRIDVLDAALPPKKDVLLYLSAVDGLSRELGLVFAGISLSPGDVTDASGSARASSSKVEESIPGLHTLETDIKMTGNQEAVYTFLRTVEQALPLMQVKDVKVSSSGQDNYSLSLRLGMLWASGNLTDIKGKISLFDEKEEGYFQQLSEYRKFQPIVRDETSGAANTKSNLFAPVQVNQIEIVSEEVIQAEEEP